MMVLKKKAMLFGIFACCLTVVIGVYFFLSNSYGGEQIVVRTINLKQEAIDHQRYLESFENSKIATEGTVTSFEGKQKVDVSILNYVSNVVGTDYKEPREETSINFIAKYDTDKNMVTLSASIIMPDGTEELDEIFGMAFMNNNGEIDAVMNIEGESILLSELKQQGLIENCGWLSRLFKAVAAAVVAVVVVVAAPVVAAVVVVAVAAYEVTEKTAAVVNYTHNKKNSDPKAYVNNQNIGGYDKWKFGLSTMNKNGCGVIAAYNLLRMRSQNKNLADVAYEIESKSGTLALGFFGTDPTHFGEYFRNKGIKATKYSKLSSLENAAKYMTSNQKIVFTAWNGTSVFEGAHVVAAEKGSRQTQEYINGRWQTITTSGYYVYNATGYGSSPTFYLSIQEYIDNGSLIIGYVVG